MKTHFEWQTPKLALSKKATQTLRQAQQLALRRAIPDFSVFGAIVVALLIIRLLGGSATNFIVVIALCVALGCYVVVPLRGVVAIHLKLRHASKPSMHVKLAEDRIFFPPLGKLGFYKYADIQSFSIALERYEEGRSQVLDLRTYDGREAVFPLDDEVSAEDLRQFLQERITAARNGRRQLPTRKYGADLKRHAVSVIVFSSICTLLFLMIFIRTEIRIARTMAAPISDVTSAADSQDSSLPDLQIKAAETLAATAMFGVLFLFGCVLMLWGDARYLRARLARLQAYLPDSALNQRQKVGDM